MKAVDPLELKQATREAARAAKQAEAARKTFGQCADELVKSKRSEWRSAKHAEQWQRPFAEQCAPIWNTPVDAVDTHAVLEVLKPIWSRTPETASRLRGRIEAVLDYAKAHKLVTGENPAAWKGNLAHVLPRRRKLDRSHYAAMPYRDVPQFVAGLRQVETFAALALEFTTMGQVLHGCATTTETIRRAIQHSQESLRTLSKRYGINPKTVAKWRQRSSVADLPTGPKEAKSTVLSIGDEAIIVAFRRHTLLPLDDCLYALQPTIPHLTRSSLHRCLQRHGISQLPDVEGSKPVKKKFKTYPIGFFHIDIAEVRTEEGKLHLFVAIDRTSKFAFIELHEKATTKVAAEFLRHLIVSVPYKIHTILTDNGIHFTIPGGGGLTVGEIKEALARGTLFRAHAFELACARNDIDHRLTKPKHPWTNGQVERMNRPSRKPPSSASITRAINSFDSISPTSSQPITSDAGSKL